MKAALAQKVGSNKPNIGCAQMTPSKEACDMEQAAKLWKLTDSQIAEAKARQGAPAAEKQPGS